VVIPCVNQRENPINIDGDWNWQASKRWKLAAFDHARKTARRIVGHGRSEKLASTGRNSTIDVHDYPITDLALNGSGLSSTIIINGSDK
jgi:hypothetical protein